MSHYNDSKSRNRKSADGLRRNSIIELPDQSETFANSSKVIPEVLKSKTVSKSYLINKLNYLNFQNKTILLNFKHKKYNRIIYRQAKPLPCYGDQLDCLWTKTTEIDQIIKFFRFHNLIVRDGSKFILAKPKILDISSGGICFKLPEKCYKAPVPSSSRQTCKDVSVQMIQNSILFDGHLISFNAVSFQIEVTLASPQSFQWINSDSNTSIIFSQKDKILYSGECRIISQAIKKEAGNFILKPQSHMAPRFKPKKFRSKRQKLVPSPNIRFKHPFTGKVVDLKIVDLAGSGFSVEDKEENGVLLPGMIIPELELTFANSFKVPCKAQVVYRNQNNGNQNGQQIRCGMAFLDMAIMDHMKLLSILQQAENKNSYVCNKVDLDDLWDFFFKTGFIYPEKYAHIQANKDQIKKTYDQLYADNSNIARHFTYQDKGVILGHTAMLRFYENTWLIHHHASITSILKAGLIVMDQIGHFSYEAHRLSSSHMDYIIFYYRPENKFPNLVFGGAARNIKNRELCSVDKFTYLHWRKTCSGRLNLPESWRLEKTTSEDLLEFKSYYERESGGIMIQALDMEPDMMGRGGLSKEYDKLGLRRERHLYSLKKFDGLKAVFMVISSDIGLNLSDLTNCVKVFIIDKDALSQEMLYSVLSTVTHKIKESMLPVLLFPSSYAEEKNIPYEKSYILWALDTQYSDHYFKHVNRLLKFQKSSLKA